jgi:hypothetical protein
LVLLCHSQTVSPEVFKMSRDTIKIDIEGRLSRALLVHDEYYAFYEVRDPMSNRPIKKFYIIEKNGKIEREIKVPEEINREFYYRLYYWRGRIIVNTEFRKGTYYLDQDKSEFIKEPEITKVPLFEDENYQVTAECHGEFGSKIYFKKKSGDTSSMDSGCPSLVNKLGGKYFVNMDGDIAEINPMSLTVRTIFGNNNFNSRFYIPTSFVAQGVLYHIYNSYHNEFSLDNKEKVVTNDSVKIGTINDGEFKPVYRLKDKLDIQLEQHLLPDYQICTFHTEERTEVGFKKDIPPYKEAKYGLIEIMGNEIRIHYFISKKTE